MRNIQPGFQIVGKNGEEIGKIASCNRDYCEVTTGFLGLGKTLFVPLDAITTSRGTIVYVNATADQVQQLGWDKPPVGRGAAQYYGTMPSGNVSEAIEAAAEDRATPLLSYIREGWPVTCAEGKEVGRVAAILPQSFILEEGPPFQHTHKRVPARDVSRVEGTRVYLNIGCGGVAQLEVVDDPGHSG